MENSIAKFSNIFILNIGEEMLCGKFWEHAYEFYMQLPLPDENTNMATRHTFKVTSSVGLIRTETSATVIVNLQD